MNNISRVDNLETEGIDTIKLYWGEVIRATDARDSFVDWSILVSSNKLFALHNSFFLIQQFSGTVIISHNGFEEQLLSGDFILLDPFKALDVSILSDSSCFLRTPVPKFQLLDTIACDIGRVVKNHSLKARVLHSSLQYHQEYQLDSEFIAGLTQLVFSGDGVDSSTIGVMDYQDHRYSKILQIIQQNILNQEFNLEALAHLVKLSRRQLQRDFSAHNTSFTTVLTEYRLNLAKEKFHMAISSGTMPNITKVAHESGFGDISNFNRVFKKHFDQSPSEYLLLLKSNGQD